MSPREYAMNSALGRSQRPLPFNDDLAYHDAGLQITFCGVGPGYDKSDFQRLCAEMPDALVAKVLGKPDVLIVNEWQHTLPPPPPLPPATIREVHDLVCFRHVASHLRLRDLDKYPLICVLFLKVDRRTLPGFGIAAEYHHLQRLESLLARVSPDRPPGLIALSSLGWHEGVALIGTDRFSTIIDAVLQLRYPETQERDSLPAGYQPLVAATITYPCIPFHQGRIDPADLSDVDLHVRVSCKSGVLTEVVEKFRDSFSPVKEAPDETSSPRFDYGFEFGPSDLNFHLRGVNSSADYVERIWNFRGGAQQLINWTDTTVSVINPVLQSSAVLLDRRVAKEALTIDVRLPDEKTVYQAVRSYNSYAADDRLYDVCSEVKPYLSHMLISPFTGDGFQDRRLASLYRENPIFFTDTVDLLLYGMHQRIFGTPLYFLQPGVVSSPWSSGIQRSLTAAGHLIRWLLRSVGQKWHGFVICAYSQDFYCYQGGVINIPWPAISSPSTWLSILHEVGHVYGDMINVTTDPRILQVCQDISVEDTHYSIDKFGDVDELIWEVFAEAFSVEIGYTIQNFDSALRRTWEYFQSYDNFAGNAPRYVLRWLLVYCYYYRRLGKPIRTKAELRRLLDRFLAEVAYLKVALNAAEKRSVLSAAWLVYGIVDVFVDILAAPQQVESVMDGDTGYVQSIVRGRVVSPVLNPAELIVRLALDEEPSALKEWAVIMSLWHQAVQEDGE